MRPVESTQRPKVGLVPIDIVGIIIDELVVVQRVPALAINNNIGRRGAELQRVERRSVLRGLRLSGHVQMLRSTDRLEMCDKRGRRHVDTTSMHASIELESDVAQRAL